MKMVRSRGFPVPTYLFGSLLSAMLLGCAVGPDYTAPELDMVRLHNTDVLAGRQTSLPAPRLDRWWSGFNDPMLEQIVQRALDQNLGLRAALARVPRLGRPRRPRVPGFCRQWMPSVQRPDSTRASTVPWARLPARFPITAARRNRTRLARAPAGRSTWLAD